MQLCFFKEVCLMFIVPLYNRKVVYSLVQVLLS